MCWLFIEKHSTVHKADDILQLVSFKKRKKSKRPDSLKLWSKALSVDITPSLPLRSREMKRFALEEGRMKKRSSATSLDASGADGGDI